MRAMLVIGAVVGFSFSVSAAGQQVGLAITSAYVFPKREAISVKFSQSIDATGPQMEPSNARFKNAPAATIGTITRSNLPYVLDVTYSGSLPVGQPVEICFQRVRFLVGGVGGKPHETTAEICRALGAPADLDAEKAAVLKKLTDVPKTARDKDIFASGFVTAASDDTAGGADLSLNPNFNVPNLNAFLKIKKATAGKGDARNFEAGAKYRYTQPWRSGQLETIAATQPGDHLNELIRERQGNLLAGWILDIAGKLEGDPTDFQVTNFVTESTFQLQTMTKGFLGRKGFWRGFVLPAGAELGHSIGTGPMAANGTATQQVTKITRYKGGAGFTLYYDNDETRWPLRRIELDANGVFRYLFSTESRFNTTTKKVDTTKDGATGYAQIDFKVFFVQTDAGRWGVKLSLNRGRLPPVFAQVKSFDFGFVMESGDNDAKTTADRKASASGKPATP